ncbi:hypothetical protein ACN4EG_27115 [Alkalinema pantanalense CENA528]|uniref:hypothetical protein n=1 Tax=Alkalinema pantanalense TaxID=1620705 RepID=UPI003D6E485B
MNYSSDKASDAESAIVDIAKSIISDKIDTLEGCRQLVTLHYQVNDSEETFLPLVGIVSETDDFPMGDERLGWSSDALSTMDCEREMYLEQVRSLIYTTCREIISKFS